jgi:glycosyltransferase involved in cell wall biosynthesis
MKGRILIVTKSLDGGTGTFVESLAKINKYLKSKAGIKILSLESPTYRKIQPKSANTTYFRINNYYPETYIISPKSITSFIKELLWIMREIKAYSPQVVIGVGIHSNLLVQIAKMQTNSFKSILTTHIDLKNTLKDKSSYIVEHMLKMLVGWLYKKTEFHICVSKSLAQGMKSYFHLSKATYIYNGVGKNRVKKEKTFPKDSFTFITFARLFKQKDHKTLLKAFAKLKDKDAKLIIGSDGPLKDELVMLSETLGIKKRVSFVGWVDNKNKYLKKADAFILSSKREGFGYVLVEAMQFGLPVISTNTKYGPEEILENGKYGILVPVGNKSIMAEKMRELMGNKKIYKDYSKKSLDRGNHFTEAKMLANYAKIIDRLI